MLAVDGDWRKSGEVTAYQSGTSWCSVWLEWSSEPFWIKAALLCHVTAPLIHFQCIHLIFLGDILSIRYAMNIVLQWMLELLRFNCALASEQCCAMCCFPLPYILQPYVLDCVLVLEGVCSLEHISKYFTEVFFLKPGWEQCWTKAVLIPALIVHGFPRLFPCEIEIQRIIYSASTKHLTHKYFPVVFHGLPFLRADLRVGKGKGKYECPAKMTTTVLMSPFEHSAEGCLLKL